MVSTIAGNGTAIPAASGLLGSAGYQDGPGLTTRWYNPYGVVSDPVGNLYVTDAFNCVLRKLTCIDCFASNTTGSYEGVIVKKSVTVGDPVATATPSVSEGVSTNGYFMAFFASILTALIF
jgi:hypothetical protein